MGRALTPMERAWRAITEDEWRDQVLESAHILGWSIAYFRAARTEHGWRTPVGADGKGWVDLTLVRDRILFVELKRELGELEPDQELWRDRLLAAGAEWYLWRPSDTDAMIATLRRRGAAS